MTKDPVCGISLDTKSAHKSAHAGRIYVFCCRTCKRTFDKEPGRYAELSGDASPGLRSPSARLASPLLTRSSIGHLLQAVLHLSLPNETQRRPTWLSARRHSRHGH